MYIVQYTILKTVYRLLVRRHCRVDLRLYRFSIVSQKSKNAKVK
jgi:hypothetical protein